MNKKKISAYIYHGDAAGLDSYLQGHPEIDVDMQLSGDPILCRATRKGHHEIAKILLKRVADPNIVVASLYFSPLEIAAEERDLDLMNLLLRNGADPNAGRPMLGAVLSGDLNVVKLLVDVGTDIHRIYDSSFTALGFCEQHGHSEIAEYLRGLGALTSREALKKRKAEQPSMLSRLG